MSKKIFFFILLIACSQQLFADWPVGKGRTSLMPGYSYFYSASSYDKQWKKNPFPAGNYFITQVVNLSIGHGIGRSVDLFVSLPFIMQKSVNQDIIIAGSGVGDLNIGISKHFSSPDQHRHVTLKASTMIPMYQKDSLISLGYGSRGVGLEANYSFSAGKSAFAIVQAQYASYLDNSEGPRQYTYTATYGRKLNMFSLVTFSFTHQDSYSINTVFNPNASVNTSFIVGRFSVSYGRRITRTIMPMLQLSTVIYGKNAGGGSGMGLTFITRLP